MKNVYSAGNYQILDEESTGRMGFSLELLGHRRKIHPRKRIPPGITSSFTLIQAGKIIFCGKST
jgi:hypothetical protein